MGGEGGHPDPASRPVKASFWQQLLAALARNDNGLHVELAALRAETAELNRRLGVAVDALVDIHNHGDSTSRRTAAAAFVQLRPGGV